MLLSLPQLVCPFLIIVIRKQGSIFNLRALHITGFISVQKSSNLRRTSILQAIAWPGPDLAKNINWSKTSREKWLLCANLVRNSGYPSQSLSWKKGLPFPNTIHLTKNIVVTLFFWYCLGQETVSFFSDKVWDGYPFFPAIFGTDNRFFPY